MVFSVSTIDTRATRRVVSTSKLARVYAVLSSILYHVLHGGWESSKSESLFMRGLG